MRAIIKKPENLLLEMIESSQKIYIKKGGKSLGNQI